jgi:hypothetical protein
MKSPGRKTRPEPVVQTSAYLTEDALDALNNIRLKLPKCRDIRITTQSDALQLSALEFSKILDSEYSRIKSASTRPMMV